MNLLIKDVFAQHPPGRQNISIVGEYGFGVFSSMGTFISFLIPIAFTIGALFVMFNFIIAAIELINSQGDKAHIVSARSKIYHTIIGLILLLALFFVVQFVLDTFGLTSLNII